MRTSSGCSQPLPDGAWTSVLRDAFCVDEGDPTGVYVGTRDDKDAREVTLERQSVQRRKPVGRNGRGSA